MKAEVTKLWRESDSGKTFQIALAQHGYVLAKGDRRDFCIIDPAGQEHSLARRIAGVKAAEIRARMQDINRDDLPRVSDGRTERRSDKKRVQEAVELGADRSGIENAINAGRVADVATPRRKADAEMERQLGIYSRTRGTRRIRERETKSLQPSSWQEKERLRRQEKELEK